MIYHNKLQLWLPVGGHIEENETPDAALLREIKEEVGLEVKILLQSALQKAGNTHTLCATPFHVSVHSVGDHDHCSLFYICEATTDNVRNNHEIMAYRWLAESELQQDDIPKDVQIIAREAFKAYKKEKTTKPI